MEKCLKIQVSEGELIKLKILHFTVYINVF